jgi:sulfate adenylyltransferase
MVGTDGFIEVFVDTPIDVCESRDIKGLYAKARRGELKGFTGIDDPYESPRLAEVTLEKADATPEQNAHAILAFLELRGFVRPDVAALVSETV